MNTAPAHPLAGSPPGETARSAGGAFTSRTPVDPSQALALLGVAAHALADTPDTGALYRAVESALGVLVGYRLFTILRATPARDGLERMHTSDLLAYPAGGVKPVGGDPWLQRLLSDSQPGLSPDAEAVTRNFPDAEAIFGLGCAAVLNIPVCFQGRILGSMNLLHEANWFEAGDAALCQPFALLLGAAWAAAPAAGLSSFSSASPGTRLAGGLS